MPRVLVSEILTPKSLPLTQEVHRIFLSLSFCVIAALVALNRHQDILLSPPLIQVTGI